MLRHNLPNNSNGHPVFLYDYFSKPQDQDAGNETLYNDYLGNMNNPKSLSIKSSVTSDGLPESSTVNKPYIFNRNVGYQMLWHNNLGTLPTNIDGKDVCGELYQVIMENTQCLF